MAALKSKDRGGSFSTDAASIGDGYVKFFHNFRDLLLTTSQLVNTQRALPLFTDIGLLLKDVMVLTEKSDKIRKLYFKGESGVDRTSYATISTSATDGLKLTPLEKKRLYDVLQIEAKCCRIRSLCKRVKYSGMGEKFGNVRMARKLCAMVDILKIRGELYELVDFIRDKIDDLSEDFDLNVSLNDLPEAVSQKFSPLFVYSDGSKNDGFISFTESTTSREDASGYVGKMKTHLQDMITHGGPKMQRLAKSALKEFDKGSRKNSTFEGLITVVTKGKAINALYSLCITYLFAEEASPNEREASRKAGNGVEEIIIDSQKLNVAALQEISDFKKITGKETGFLVKYGAHYIHPRTSNVHLLNQVPGRTLSELIHSKDIITQKQAIDMGVQIVKAIRFAHGRAIPLGTINSHSMYIREVNSGRQVKVLTLLNPLAEAIGSSAHQLRGVKFPGDIGLENSRYLAPELWSKQDTTRDLIKRRRTFSGDIYAFAIVLWEIIERERPYESAANLKEILETVKKNYRPPSSTGTTDSNVHKFESKQLQKLLDLCWHETPTKRPSSFRLLKKRGVLYSLKKKLK